MSKIPVPPTRPFPPQPEPYPFGQSDPNDYLHNRGCSGTFVIIMLILAAFFVSCGEDTKYKVIEKFIEPIVITKDSIIIKEITNSNHPIAEIHRCNYADLEDYCVKVNTGKKIKKYYVSQYTYNNIVLGDVVSSSLLFEEDTNNIEDCR